MPAATLASMSRALVGRVSAASEPASTAASPLVPVSRRDPRVPAPAAVSRPPFSVSVSRQPLLVVPAVRRARRPHLGCAASCLRPTPLDRAEPPCGFPSLAENRVADCLAH